MLRFEEEEQSNASKHSRLLRQPRMRSREICDDEEACEVHSDEASGGPVSPAREKPGKERGGAPPLHPGAAGAEAKGAKARRGTSDWYMRLCAADHTAGSARLLFRVPFAAPAQGRLLPWLPRGLRSRGAVVNDMPVACQSRA